MVDWVEHNGIWMPVCPRCGNSELEQVKIGKKTWMWCHQCEWYYKLKFPSQLRGRPIAMPSKINAISSQLASLIDARTLTRCNRCSRLLTNYTEVRCPFCGYRIPKSTPIQRSVKMKL